MRTFLLLLALIVAGVAGSKALATAAPKDDGFTFTTIDFPGARSTRISGINDHGDVVGDAAIRGRFFSVLLTNKGYTVIELPAAFFTTAFGVNNRRGEIAGWFVDQGNAIHGFIAR